MTSVIIPWRQGCPFRERALAWVLDRWAERFPTFDVVLGLHEDGPWCKAAAVADGLSKVADGSLIIADADVWLVRPEALTDAVGALSDHGWAIPHGDVQRLTETASEAFMADQPLPPRPGQYAGDAERSDALAADNAGGCGQNRGPDPRVRREHAAASATGRCHGGLMRSRRRSPGSHRRHPGPVPR